MNHSQASSIEHPVSLVRHSFSEGGSIQYRESSIEYPVSRIQNRVSSIEYRESSIQRTKRVNYAKQTQFTGCPNVRKCCYNKVLCQYTPPQPLQKQSQSKPIKPNQTQFQTRYAENKPKQTQFKTTPAQQFNKIINNQ